MCRRLDGKTVNVEMVRHDDMGKVRKVGK